MKKFLRVSIALVVLMSIIMVSLVGNSTPAQASDSKVYSGTNVVIAAGATYEITPDTDGSIAGTLVISGDKAGYQLQGWDGTSWVTVVLYAPKSGTYPVVNSGTRIKNPLSSSITVTYTLTCTVTYGPFVAMDADDARHTPSDLNYEWWYFDANFTNGYSATVVFFYPGNAVQCAIYDPSGNKVTSDAAFTTGSASTSNCDVNIGTGNRFWGSYPDWHLTYMYNGTGVNLNMHSMVEGWKTPTTGVKQMTTSPNTWMGWVIAQPRSAVTGTITINGTPMTVTGSGYHDHNWGNTALHDQFDHWYWGRIFLPGYTMVYSTGNMTHALGYGTNNLWLTFKDKTFYDVNLLVTSAANNLVADPAAGHPYPTQMVYTIPTGSLVHGTVTQNLTQLIEGYSLPTGGAYFRFLSNGIIDLYAGTNHISVTQPLLHEYMIP